MNEGSWSGAWRVSWSRRGNLPRRRTRERPGSGLQRSRQRVTIGSPSAEQSKELAQARQAGEVSKLSRGPRREGHTGAHENQRPVVERALRRWVAIVALAALRHRGCERQRLELVGRQGPGRCTRAPTPASRTKGTPPIRRSPTRRSATAASPTPPRWIPTPMARCPLRRYGGTTDGPARRARRRRRRLRARLSPGHVPQLDRRLRARDARRGRSEHERDGDEVRRHPQHAWDDRKRVHRPPGVARDPPAIRCHAWMS